MTSVLETRYRALLRILPADYRAAWEEEMVATFLQGMVTDEFQRPAGAQQQPPVQDVPPRLRLRSHRPTSLRH